MKDMDKFNQLKMPETSYQNEMKEASISPIESWLKSYIIENFYEVVYFSMQLQNRHQV